MKKNIFSFDENDINEVWKYFWKPFVTKFGFINLNQLKKELYEQKISNPRG